MRYIENPEEKEYKFQNKYGSIIVHRISEFRPVKGYSTETHPEILENSFSIDDAEKIALITENNGAIVSTCFPRMDRAFLVVYADKSTIALCTFTLESFSCEQSPAEELEELNTRDGALMFISAM